MQPCPCCVPSKMTSLKEDVRRSAMLCILTVPATMTSHDLMKFVASFYEVIEHMKIIRDSTPNQYMVLIKFSSQVRGCQHALAAGMSPTVAALGSPEPGLHLSLEKQPCPPSQRIPRASEVGPTPGSGGCHVLAVLFSWLDIFQKLLHFQSSLLSLSFFRVLCCAERKGPSQECCLSFKERLFLLF